MGSSIHVRSATPVDAPAAAKLLFMTGGSVAEYLFGSDARDGAKAALEGLFEHGRNRYSHRFARVAEIDGEVAGLVLSYSGKTMSRLRLPMFGDLIGVLGVAGTTRFLFRSVPLIGVKEVQADEYFINSLAVSPEFRGRGIGTQLMALAEESAMQAGLARCSLTVDVDKERALGLYEHLGYRIEDTTRIQRLEKLLGHEGLHRMVKTL